MKLLALLLLAGCRYGYYLPDGGPVPELGDGCSCADIQLQVVDDVTNQVLLECLPNPALQCDERRGVRPDGGACPAVTACFGSRCCLWVEGRP